MRILALRLQISELIRCPTFTLTTCERGCPFSLLSSDACVTVHNDARHFARSLRASPACAERCDLCNEQQPMDLGPISMAFPGVPDNNEVTLLVSQL